MPINVIVLFELCCIFVFFLFFFFLFFFFPFVFLLVRPLDGTLDPTRFFYKKPLYKQPTILAKVPGTLSKCYGKL